MSKTDKSMLDDQELEGFFDAIKSEDVSPSDALVTRVLQDAVKEQPIPDVSLANRAAQPVRQSFWREFLASVGGWPAMAGMATATVAGVWIGFAAPTQLETLSGGLILNGDYALADETYALEDLSPSFLGTGVLMEDEG